MYPLFESDIGRIFTSYEKRSYDFAPHFHNHIEITYCFSGAQKIKAYGKIFTLKKGDAFIVFPNVVHEYIQSPTPPDENTKSIALICDSEYFTNIIPDIKTSMPENPFIGHELVSKSAEFAFRQMLKTSDKLELLGFGIIVLSNLMNCIALKPLKSSDNLRLAPQITSFITLNFNKPLTIEYIAKEFGYNPSYIAHIFCDQLNIPFKTYLGSVRSEYAARLIASTDKSLTEIAYECGYNSLNTFCRNFKRRFMQTPSQYKKSVRKQS